MNWGFSLGFRRRKKRKKKKDFLKQLSTDIKEGRRYGEGEKRGKEEKERKEKLYSQIAKL
jgi:hypothetical protein